MTPAAYLTRNTDGDPAMLFFDPAEAADYCDDAEQPEALVLASDAQAVLYRIREELQFGTKANALDIIRQALS